MLDVNYVFDGISFNFPFSLLLLDNATSDIDVTCMNSDLRHYQGRYYNYPCNYVLWIMDDSAYYMMNRLRRIAMRSIFRSIFINNFEVS